MKCYAHLQVFPFVRVEVGVDEDGVQGEPQASHEGDPDAVMLPQARDRTRFRHRRPL